MSKKEKCKLGISVIYLSSIKGNVRLPPNSLYTLRIDYPLDVGVGFPVKTGKQGMDITEILGTIGDAYEKVYATPNHFGIWGHGIGDLVLESVTVDHDSKLITLSVGS